MLFKALKYFLVNRVYQLGYQHFGTQEDETSAAKEDLNAATSPTKSGKGSRGS